MANSRWQIHEGTGEIYERPEGSNQRDALTSLGTAAGS